MTDPITSSHIGEINGLQFELVFVKGGKFLMGDRKEGAFRYDLPVHEVQVPDFYLGRCLVSQDFWTAVMGSNPSFWQGLPHPVEQVSWEDCQEFLVKLRAKTGIHYRLPSESEWEYTARGGLHSQDYDFSGSEVLSEVGWYNKNSSLQTHPSKMKRGNELGICDMSGSLYEWCEDRWHDSYHKAPDDGSAWLGGGGVPRVIRGGYWFSNSEHCRVPLRNSGDPQDRDYDIGFRLALSPESVG